MAARGDVALFGKPIHSDTDPEEGPAPRNPESPGQRENNVRNDLLKRLRTVCKDLPEEEFQDLVAAMTREQLRSERLH